MSLGASDSLPEGGLQERKGERRTSAQAVRMAGAVWGLPPDLRGKGWPNGSATGEFRNPGVNRGISSGAPIR
jgi:hypothetical protein